MTSLYIASFPDSRYLQQTSPTRTKLELTRLNSAYRLIISSVIDSVNDGGSLSDRSVTKLKVLSIEDASCDPCVFTSIHTISVGIFSGARTNRK